MFDLTSDFSDFISDFIADLAAWPFRSTRMMSIAEPSRGGHKLAA
jgi:hypothetical protein